MNGLDALKSFVAVKFIDYGSHDIVYKEWLQTDTQCRWPHNVSGQRLQTMVKDMVESHENWPTYRCSVLCQANTYERCLIKTYEAGQFVQSCAEKSNSDNETTAVQSSTSISISRDSSVKYTALSMKRGEPLKSKFPGPTTEKPKVSTYVQPLNVNDSDRNITPSLPFTSKTKHASASPNKEGLSKQVFAKPSLPLKAKVPKIKSQQSKLRALPDEMQILRCDIYGNGRKMDNVSIELHEMREEIQKMHEELQHVRNLLTENCSPLSVNPVHDSRITAANTLSELDDTIENLEDYRYVAKLVEGKSVHDTIRNLMKMFLARELAMQFTWTGRGEGNKTSKRKFSFQDHKILHVLNRILQYTQHRNSTMTERQVEVKRTLNQSADWNGGRRKRHKFSTRESEDDDTEPCQSDDS